MKTELSTTSSKGDFRKQAKRTHRGKKGDGWRVSFSETCGWKAWLSLHIIPPCCLIPNPTVRAQVFVNEISNPHGLPLKLELLWKATLLVMSPSEEALAFYSCRGFSTFTWHEAASRSHLIVFVDFSPPFRLGKLLEGRDQSVQSPAVFRTESTKHVYPGWISIWLVLSFWDIRK